MNELLSRRPIQMLKLEDNNVMVLCEDGSMWVGRVSAMSFETQWRRINDIPTVSDE